MFSSTVLDVAVGLTFVFMAISLATSAILEAIAGIITWRSGTLLNGIRALVNDDKFTGLAAQLYQHALINPRNDGRIDAAIDAPAAPGTALEKGKRIEKTLRKGAPAYIGPKQFANALIDILNTGKADVTVTEADAAHPGKMVNGNTDSINKAIDHVVPAEVNPQINKLLRGIARRAAGDLDQMKQEIETWFDNAMDRLSGFYKRWTQLWQFLIALGLAVLLNVSAIHVAKMLWQQPIDTKIIESMDKQKLPDVETAFQTLDKLPLPIGWSHYTPASTGRLEALDWLEMSLGWLITALAALFGAPFWFDLLQQIVRLKAAGPSPKEKQHDKAAAA